MAETGLPKAPSRYLKIGKHISLLQDDCQDSVYEPIYKLMVNRYEISDEYAKNSINSYANVPSASDLARWKAGTKNSNSHELKKVMVQIKGLTLDQLYEVYERLFNASLLRANWLDMGLTARAIIDFHINHKKGNQFYPSSHDGRYRPWEAEEKKQIEANFENGVNAMINLLNRSKNSPEDEKKNDENNEMNDAVVRVPLAPITPNIEGRARRSRSARTPAQQSEVVVPAEMVGMVHAITASNANLQQAISTINDNNVDAHMATMRDLARAQVEIGDLKSDLKTKQRDILRLRSKVNRRQGRLQLYRSYMGASRVQQKRKNFRSVCKRTAKERVKMLESIMTGIGLFDNKFDFVRSQLRRAFETDKDSRNEMVEAAKKEVIDGINKKKRAEELKPSTAGYWHVLTVCADTSRAQMLLFRRTIWFSEMTDNGRWHHMRKKDNSGVIQTMGVSIYKLKEARKALRDDHPALFPKMMELPSNSDRRQCFYWDLYAVILDYLQVWSVTNELDDNFTLHERMLIAEYADDLAELEENERLC